MSNEVEIDHARLEAEADQALIDAGIDALATASDAVATESWGPFVAGLVPVMRGTIIPQWSVHDQQLKEFGEALTECLDQAFPGGLSGRYACWARLAMCGAGIVAVNVMSNGGKLPPLGPPKAEGGDDGNGEKQD